MKRQVAEYLDNSAASNRSNSYRPSIDRMLRTASKRGKFARYLLTNFTTRWQCGHSPRRRPTKRPDREVISQVRRLLARSAPGPDGLTYQNWKIQKQDYRLILTVSRIAKKIPDSWKTVQQYWLKRTNDLPTEHHIQTLCCLYYKEDHILGYRSGEVDAISYAQKLLKDAPSILFFFNPVCKTLEEGVGKFTLHSWTWKMH